MSGSPRIALRLQREGPGGGFVRAGEIGGDRLGDLAGGRPFRAAQERGDEAHAFKGLGVMAKRGMEDPAPAILDGHQCRLVTTGSL